MQVATWTQVGSILILFTITAMGFESEGSHPDVVAFTNQGAVVGKALREAGVFKGIPYSQPPTGYCRWRDPRDPLPYDKSYWNATYYRPGCLQVCHQMQENFTCPDWISEDCLYLNIWVPKRILARASEGNLIGGRHYVITSEYRKIPSKRLAVMVFLHGGNFIEGAGSAALYDSRFLAQNGDVLVVTLNYRLGPMGFLVQGRGKNAALGNYGIKDQIKALKWVRDNIANFGGNPNKVTLHGQSAGAESVAILMTSHKAKDLFHRAIMESNPFGIPFRTMTSARKFGGKFTQVVGCRRNDIRCLRRATPDRLLRAYNKTHVDIFGVKKHMIAFQPWGPVVDGYFIRETPLLAFKKGKAMKIPTITGSNVNEGLVFVYAMYKQPIASFMYMLSVGIAEPVKSGQILKRYPAKKCSGGKICDSRYSLGKIANDYIFVCPEREALFHMAHQSWMYVFNQSLPVKVKTNELCKAHVCHGAELPYVFGSFNAPKAKEAELSFKKKGEMLSHRMQLYWSNFAKYGNPNGNSNKADSWRKSATYESSGTMHWPLFRNYHASSYQAIQFSADGDFVMNNPYRDTCSFWDKLDIYNRS